MPPTVAAVLTGLLLLLAALVATALLYARGIAGSTGEPYLETLRSLVKQIFSGDFF